MVRFFFLLMYIVEASYKNTECKNNPHIATDVSRAGSKCALFGEFHCELEHSKLLITTIFIQNCIQNRRNQPNFENFKQNPNMSKLNLDKRIEDENINVFDSQGMRTL